jgi:RNA polymerase sigma factor (sigma-70 family)
LAETKTEELRDRGAREAFVRASYAQLFRWLCRLAGSSDEAADLTQETFAAFWASLARKPAATSPRTWLYAIGRNLWRKQARDRKRVEPVVLSLLADGDRSPENRALDREFQAAVRQALTELPEDLREAFTLRFWNDLEYEEIGQIQEVSAGLARWRYFAARKRLSEQLAAWDPRSEQAKEDRHAR